MHENIDLITYLTKHNFSNVTSTLANKQLKIAGILTNDSQYSILVKPDEKDFINI